VITDQIVEEPCEVKISSTVLKTSRRGDSPAEFIKLADNRKSITFSDKKGIGRLKLKGTRDLYFYQINQIKRVRLVKRADGVYVQFCIDVDRSEDIEPTGNTVGLDVGLKEYYTDSSGAMVDNPKFLLRSEKVLKRSQRRISRRVKGSKNRGKARQILGNRHLKISRQRKDHAVKLARCVVQSNDLIAYVSEAGRS
jgi:putative transposase